MNYELFTKFVVEKCYIFLQKHVHTDQMVYDLSDLIADIFLETKDKNLSYVALKINLKKERENVNKSISQFPHSKNAFHVNLKLETLRYFQKYSSLFSSNEDNCLPVIVYADDIVLSGTGKNTTSYLHIAYKFSCIKSSKLKHYMTYGASITKLENENNYQKILKSVMKTFNDTTFDFNGITKKLKPIFFISDNAMMQSAFQLKKCYSNKSKNSCKACTINGEDFHLYTKKKALETFLRESYHSYFPRNNHFIFDTFHDLQG
uniref:Reverse transcriptase domain-containing protein n=1 Tax=Strongyloides venezuelensis TaxID=75913 RepID=A0A0K0FIE2_STRVS